MNEILENTNKTLRHELEKLDLKRRFPKLHENSEKLLKDIEDGIVNYKKIIDLSDNKQPCVRSHDAIREQINKITDGKIGSRPENQEWLDKLYDEGKNRYENNIPPGFKDERKERASDRFFFYDELKYDRLYSDLLIWKQIISHAKNNDVKNVILIIDDAKDDWWYNIDSRGKKQVGPLANLQSEIYRESNIDAFQMYNAPLFLENGKKILKVGVHESSIKDANSFNNIAMKIYHQNSNEKAFMLYEIAKAIKEAQSKLENEENDLISDNLRDQEAIQDFDSMLQRYDVDGLSKKQINYRKEIERKFILKSLIDKERERKHQEENQQEFKWINYLCKKNNEIDED